MGLTITNTNTLSLLNILNRNTAAQSNTLTQLSTGFRINKGADDPAGLIASASLSRELIAVEEAINSNQRTDSILTVADGALGEISALLDEIESLAAASTNEAGLSASEVAANQAQIDNALTAIDRIVNTTQFNGLKLIDGTNSIGTTSVDGSRITNLRIYSRSQSSSAVSLTVTRQASATTASAVLGPPAAPTSTARTSGTTQLMVNGTLGAASISLASGLTKAQIVSEINAAKDQTGVSAIVNTGALGSSIQLNSTTYGTDAFVSVEVLSGGVINSSYGTSTGDGSTANDLTSVNKQFGVDAQITINGQSTGADGLDVTYNGGGISLSFSLAEAFGNGSVAATTSTFSVQASGGATFQLGTETNTRQTIGIDSLNTSKLGGGDSGAILAELKSGGAADLRTNVATALQAVKKAQGQVAEIRGRIGGFQKFQVQAAIRNLQTTQTGLEDARSAIRDTDYAVATARLNQQTVLTQTTVSLLGLAGQQSAQILALLG